MTALLVLAAALSGGRMHAAPAMPRTVAAGGDGYFQSPQRRRESMSRGDGASRRRRGGGANERRPARGLDGHDRRGRGRGRQPRPGLAASEIAVEELPRVEDLLTTWRDSPLAGSTRRRRAATSRSRTSSRRRCRTSSHGPAHRGRLRSDPRAPRPRLGPARQGTDRLGRRDRRGARRRRQRSHFRSTPIAGPRAASAPARASTRAHGARATPSTPRLAASRPRGSATRASTSADSSWPSAGPGPAPLGDPVAHPRERDHAVLTLALSDALGLDLGQLGARPHGLRRPHRAPARPALRKARAGFRLRHGRRPDRPRRGRALDGVLRARARARTALSEALRREGVPQEVLFLVDGGERPAPRAARRAFRNIVIRVDAEAVDGLATRTASSTPPQLHNRRNR